MNPIRNKTNMRILTLISAYIYLPIWSITLECFIFISFKVRFVCYWNWLFKSLTFVQHFLNTSNTFEQACPTKLVTLYILKCKYWHFCYFKFFPKYSMHWKSTRIEVSLPVFWESGNPCSLFVGSIIRLKYFNFFWFVCLVVLASTAMSTNTSYITSITLIVTCTYSLVNAISKNTLLTGLLLTQYDSFKKDTKRKDWKERKERFNHCNK